MSIITIIAMLIIAHSRRNSSMNQNTLYLLGRNETTWVGFQTNILLDSRRRNLQDPHPNEVFCLPLFNVIGNCQHKARGMT